jgi:hypothetical protein
MFSVDRYREDWNMFYAQEDLPAINSGLTELKWLKCAVSEFPLVMWYVSKETFLRQPSRSKEYGTSLEMGLLKHISTVLDAESLDTNLLLAATGKQKQEV